MKTFKCTASVDVFTRLFELVIEKDILMLSDENYYEADYGCCIFNTRRKNSFQHITRIQLASCSKTNLSKDWRSYWFYLKVDMSKIPGYTGPAYPLYSPIDPMTTITTAIYNALTLGFKSYENC
jgi:aspartate/methionine/tyrosine aminotransferase